MALSCEEETVVQFRTRNEQFCELVQGWSGYRGESRPTGLPVALRSACRTIWPNRHLNFGKRFFSQQTELCRRHPMSSRALPYVAQLLLVSTWALFHMVLSTHVL